MAQDILRGARLISIACRGFTKDGAKRHLHHIYQKPGVSSRAGATAEALRRGLL